MTEDQVRERRRSEPPPVFLSVADVLDYCVDNLSKVAADQSLIVLIGGVAKDSGLMKDAPSQVKEIVNTAMIEPERQERVLAETIKLLRSLSTEHRVLDMRELDRLRSEKKEG